MASKKHELQQTKGAFQVVGVVSGVLKDKFYVDTMTKKNKPFRSISFGVEFEKGKTLYISLNGMEQEKVFFSGRDEETKKNFTKDVPWSQRNTFQEDGLRLIGTGLGLTKGEDGKNVRTTLVPFDACEYISQNLKDGMSIFIKGDIEYSTYTNNNQTRRNVKFVPNQISLLSADLDLDALDFSPQADFKQRIVYTGIDKAEGEFKLTAKIINYSSIEDAEFVVKDNSLANIFKKNLKPYNSIDVHGVVAVTEDTTQTQDDDCWGESSKIDAVNAPIKRDLVITGATKSSLDTDLYSETKVLSTIKLLTQEKQVVEEEWGNKGKDLVEDDQDMW